MRRDERHPVPRFATGIRGRLTLGVATHQRLAQNPAMRSLLLSLLLAATALDAPFAQGAHNREIENVAAFARLYGVTRYFYPSDLAARIDWDAFAVHGVRQVREAGDPRALQAKLAALFAPLGRGIQIVDKLPPAPAKGQPDKDLVAWRYFGAAVATPAGPYRAKRTNRTLAATANSPEVTGELFDAMPITGAHLDVELGSGVQARVPLALTDADAAAPADGAFQALESALQQVKPSAPVEDLDTRLASTVVAWNVFRHFYPYWTEAGVDWDGRLRPLLELARQATTRDAHRAALRTLVADIRDGHGGVTDPTRTGRAGLPVRFGVVENQIVVVASNDPQTVAVGTVVSMVGGTPAKTRLAEAVALWSGTPQWKEFRALQEIASCDKGSSVELSLAFDGAARPVTLPCATTQPPADRRPEPIVELKPRVWYVDLTRATAEQLRPVMATLATAAGVVFDLRGYPTDAGARVLPFLLGEPESDRWMHIAQITGPFGEMAGWQSVGWNMKPATPRITGTVVFMTDGRAISYAESVMGYVKDRKLGTVVGSATAGANGNVIRFPVPGGFTIMFTGMRVTGHDGQTPFHLAGVQPDVPATPTIKGLREGRDEVLERALAIVQGR
jgi:hypothetical protein